MTYQQITDLAGALGIVVSADAWDAFDIPRSLEEGGKTMWPVFDLHFKPLASRELRFKAKNEVANAIKDGKVFAPSGMWAQMQPGPQMSVVFRLGAQAMAVFEKEGIPKGSMKPPWGNESNPSVIIFDKRDPANPRLLVTYVNQDWRVDPHLTSSLGLDKESFLGKLS